MTYPINVKRGWIQVILSPEKKFDNPVEFHELTDPEEIQICWDSIKQIVDKIVEEQVEQSKAVMQQNAKMRQVADIYNSIAIKKTVDENALLNEVRKTCKFSEDEAKSLIKKVKEKNVEGGMAWY